MDFNLYPVFLEIMRTRSVTRAAEALGLTQAATSNALARLRNQLNDPLFVRSKGGMLPTHYALSIQPKIEQSMAGLQSLTREQHTELPDISAIRRMFSIIMSDLEEALFLPDLVRLLAVHAPGISLDVRPFRRDALQAQLESGRADLLLAHLTATTNNVVSARLSRQEFACVSRKDHPVVLTRLQLEDYVAFGHILVAPDKGSRRGVVDDVLADLGRNRNIACSVPRFLPACLLAAQSDHLLTLPRQLGEKVASQFGLVVHDLPFELPGFSIGLHWHQTRDSDPEHIVFREFVLGRSRMSSAAGISRS